MHMRTLAAMPPRDGHVIWPPFVIGPPPMIDIITVSARRQKLAAGLVRLLEAENTRCACWSAANRKGHREPRPRAMRC